MLILVRGIPGSGKSTWANKQATVYDYVYEADEYFYRLDGEYDFNYKLLPNAHKYCYDMTVGALDGIKEFGVKGDVYVANTFTQLWEIKRYIDYADANGIPFKVVRCTGNYQNIHGVPDSKVQQMLARFEDYEGEEFV